MAKELFSAEVILKNKELIGELLNDNSLMGVYVIDEDYKIMAFNDTFRENYPGINIGDECYDKLCGRDTPCEDCLRRRTGLSHHTVQGEYKDLKRNCNVMVKMSSIVWDQNQSGYLLRIYDKAISPQDKEKMLNFAVEVDAFEKEHQAVIDVDFSNNRFTFIHGELGGIKLNGEFSTGFVTPLANIVHRDDVVELTQFIMRGNDIANDASYPGQEDEVVDFRMLNNYQEYEWFRIKKYPRRNDSRHFMLALRDIREEKQKESDYNFKMREALRIANISVETKSVFLSNIATEIRTPMNNIKGMLQIAKKNYEDKEKMMECLSKVETSANVLLSLMSDVLELSKIETGRYVLSNEEFSMKELMSDIKKEYEQKAWNKGIEFVTDITLLDYDRFLGDGAKLAQVLSNLLDNALKFTNKDGKTGINLNVVYVMGENVGLRFEIIDNGAGMSEEEIKRLFNPLNYPNIDSDKHIGLGITIAKSLVDMMDGYLKIESIKGRGTKATVDISLKVQEAEPAPRKTLRTVRTSMPKELNGRRILIVEDNPINLDVAVEILESRGLIIESAVNGREGLQKFEESAPGYYDAIIMDIQMPVMNGYEAARAIRTSYHEDGKNIPIIATTAMAFDEDVAKAKLSGMNAHVTKPIDFNRLCSIILDYL